MYVVAISFTYIANSVLYVAHKYLILDLICDPTAPVMRFLQSCDPSNHSYVL